MLSVFHHASGRPNEHPLREPVPPARYHALKVERDSVLRGCGRGVVAGDRVVGEAAQQSSRRRCPGVLELPTL
jgi:hypothetical protein